LVTLDGLDGPCTRKEVGVGARDAWSGSSTLVCGSLLWQRDGTAAIVRWLRVGSFEVRGAVENEIDPEIGEEPVERGERKEVKRARSATLTLIFLLKNYLSRAGQG
jgi:hypothetical protein